MTSWDERYGALADHVTKSTSATGPHLVGFNSCVDRVYRLGERGAARLEVSARGGGEEGDAARAVLDYLAAKGDGELFVDWPDGGRWAQGILGSTWRDQIGGTGPQAAWSLTELGAPTVVAAQDRSAAQLGVLPERCHLVEDGALVAPGQARERAEGVAKLPHFILEYDAGLRVGDVVLTRSSRLILRFMADGIEVDESFRSALPSLLTRKSSFLISGMNGIRTDDHDSLPWLSAVVDDVAACRSAGGGPATIHLELAEYPEEGDTERMCRLFGGRADSLGLNADEARVFAKHDEPLTETAARLGDEFGFRRVYVHSDTWAMCAHLGEPGEADPALMTGALLASGRAATGRPPAVPRLDPQATFTADHPAPGRHGQWQVDVVPCPYLPTPASTVGLGDTFTAGLLLAATI